MLQKAIIGKSETKKIKDKNSLSLLAGKLELRNTTMTNNEKKPTTGNS